VFYSISNYESGLEGVSVKRFGRDLGALATAIRERLVNSGDKVCLAQCTAAFLERETLAERCDPVAHSIWTTTRGSNAQTESADLSAKDLRDSFGVMLNYLYDLAAIQAKHECFVRGEVVRQPSGADAFLKSVIFVSTPTHL
jgi:malonyl-CoA decarboxylase